ncbi:hypothetical protein [Mesorhizobium sp. Root172]|uniref:hypothetical protein n=1 Tax=Mesorhizobium sp. Root172 TaxID=1736481 RepID=UPI0012E3340A|nr:hypothetical protein [Mesorhizobium sp. Root172]
MAERGSSAFGVQISIGAILPSTTKLEATAASKSPHERKPSSPEAPRMLATTIQEGIVVKRTAASHLVAALAMALVLIAQSVVGAYALGVAGAGPQLDSFGNPLCLNSSDHDGGTDSGLPGHSKLPPCCTFACSMFWPGMAASTDFARLAVSVRISDPVIFAYPRSIDLPAPDYRQGNPRAPPVNA